MVTTNVTKQGANVTPGRNLTGHHHPEHLRAEYQNRQQSSRPLPASVAKAYEILIDRAQNGGLQATK